MLLQAVHAVRVDEGVARDGRHEQLYEHHQLGRAQGIHQLGGGAEGQPLGEEVDLADDGQLLEQRQVGELACRDRYKHRYHHICEEIL